ncbi:hypothetical protein BDF20DRAFT_822727, partial [Mycotypha africana]|uniref:uncharacterized protein n=1 Tax=Mycotypha africana TaxID=64632 RepID=UPI00230034F2
MPIKLTSKGAIQLTSSNVNNTGKTRSTPLHSLGGNNPFFHEKRRWEDSFDTAEKQALPGNIVKAAKDKNGETYVTLQEEEFLKVSSKPNSIHDDESQDSDGVESTVSKKPGRKPMPDEEITSDSEQDPKVKRKAQNRAAQRAFRERKERYVKELEARIKQVQDAHFIATAQLVDENQQLRAIIYKLESENCALKGIPIQPYQHLYQAPSSSQNPQAQQHLHLNTDSNAGSGTNYAHIAPLIPNTPASTAISQTAVKKTHKNNQPLEYTFSISTPASLRHNHGNASSSFSK